MTKTLLWDAGPGEIRAGLVEDGKLVEFRIIRQRRQKALYAAGEKYTARIVAKLGGRKALVTIGGDVEAILENAPKLAEGALLAVQMTRAPIPEPGRWKRAVVKPLPDEAIHAEPAWHFSEEPWALFLRRIACSIDKIVCADPVIAGDIRMDCPELVVPISIDLSAISDVDFDSLIDVAITGEFPINGGMLSIERTRAMTMVDIDGSGDPLALNLAAAAEIARLLRLLDIGGQIGIDFLSLPDRQSRLAVDAALGAACEALGQHERTAINGFGFAQIVRPRTGPSIPEILCGTTPGRLSLESRAVALLREAGRSVGHGRRRLIAPPATIELIRQWPEETGALRHSLGVEIELVPDSSVTGYGHVHVSQ
jgi:Ribonuclease G/E